MKHRVMDSLLAPVSLPEESSHHARGPPGGTPVDRPNYWEPSAQARVILRLQMDSPRNPREVSVIVVGFQPEEQLQSSGEESTHQMATSRRRVSLLSSQLSARSSKLSLRSARSSDEQSLSSYSQGTRSRSSGLQSTGENSDEPELDGFEGEGGRAISPSSPFVSSPIAIPQLT